MATSATEIYQKQNGDLQGKADVGDVNGRVRLMKIEFTGERAVYAIADIIKICKMEAGARIIDAHLYVPSLGTTGIFNFGWAASPSHVEVPEVADPDGLASTAPDAGGQVADYRLLGASAGFMKKFTGQVDIQLAFTEATTAATGIVFKGYIAYVVE